MRRLLPLFLVLLLVLRGLLGNAMAMGNLPPAPAPAAGVHAQHTAHPMPTGGHGMEAPAQHDAGGHASLTRAESCSADTPGCGHGHDGPCTACGICHSAFFSAIAALPMPEPAPHALPRCGSARFVSALPAPASKPPIV